MLELGMQAARVKYNSNQAVMFCRYFATAGILLHRGSFGS